jgi:Lrp/AsnC family transcriptional regulator for asnA, asnC and gidA
VDRVTPSVPDLDDIDKLIIAELQRDGRISYADLAPRVGLSPAATRQRVQRLIESETVRIVAVTDPQSIGYPVMAMLGIRVNGDVTAVADALAEIPGVIYVVYSSGQFDLLVEMISETSMSLLGRINESVRCVPGVESVENFLYFGTHTHRFGWPIP